MVRDANANPRHGPICSDGKLIQIQGVPGFVQDCIQLTVQAAATAPVPRGCLKTIYLCDDGKDREKQEWMKSLGQGYVYVSGRTRPQGESNGKSGNLNNAFAQIYPPELEIPGNEVLCIFDADQVGTPQMYFIFEFKISILLR